MNIIQLCQILFVALIGAFALIVSLNNARDPQSNLLLVKHLLSMDSVFPDTRLKDRAILSPVAHRAAFWLIVALEAVTAALCLYGLRPVVRGVHGDRRPVVRQLAVEAMERAGVRLHVLHGDRHCLPCLAASSLIYLTLQRRNRP